jgi:hypothetical protein
MTRTSNNHRKRCAGGGPGRGSGRLLLDTVLLCAVGDGLPACICVPGYMQYLPVTTPRTQGHE